MINIFVNIYIFILLADSLVGVFNYKKLSIPIKFLTLLACMTCCSESLAKFLGHRNNNNSEVYHFYVIISFWVYFLIYFKLFKNARQKLVFLNIAIFFTIFCVINSLYYQKLDSIPSINLTVNNVILVFLSLFYFKTLIDENPFEDIRKNSLFWFNTSVLIYYTLQIFSWGIMNYLISTGKNIVPLIIFGIFLSIIYNIAIGITIALDGRKSRK